MMSGRTSRSRSTRPSTFSLLLCLMGLLAITLGSPFTFAMAGCARQYRLVFKSPEQPGTPSFITQENQPVNLIPGSATPLPAVVLQLYYYDTKTSSWLLDQAQEAKVQVAIVPPRLITGDTATVSRGEALFSAITVDGVNEAGVVYHFQFNTTIPNFPSDTLLGLTTGSINLLGAEDRNRFARIAFSNSGFIYREGQTREIPAASNLLPIYIVPTSTSGHTLPSTGTTVGVSITATGGRIEQSQNAYTGTSVVSIVGIRFIPNDPSVTTTVLTFTGTDGTVVSAISTGVLNVSYFRVRNKFLIFDSSTSFFESENIGKTAVLGIALPKIVVQVVSSDYSTDSSNSGLVIRAHSQQASLIGAEAQVVQGKATFSRLTFTDYAPESAIITFTAGPQGDLEVRGYNLYSGAVMVSLTAVKAKYMEFDQSSFISATVARTVQVKTDNTFVIPSIIVVFKDSAYLLDTSLSGATLMVVSSVPSIEPSASRNTAVQNGVAAFTNLEFKGGVDGISFTLSITDENGELDSITSARITLAGAESTTAAYRRTDLQKCIAAPSTSTATESCAYSIAFDTSAQTLISAEGQTLFATLGEFVPSINVVLYDIFGAVDSIDSSIVPRLIAYTGDDPLSETLLVTTDNANVGKWRDKYYTFTCLRFSERPAGLVRLRFAAVTNTSVLYLGINTLQTGYVTVAASSTPVYGLRFASEDSLFLYTNQISSAVVNIALPQITIEVIDSLYQFDSTANNIVIVASTSTGQIDTDGSTAVVKNGVATFTTLKFSTVADNPILTFRAQQTSAAVQGKTVTTGIISLTQLPTPTSQIVFGSTLNNNNNFTDQYQSMTFDVLSDAVIFASITARDSAHQFSESFTDTVTIEVKCDEATLQTASSIQIGGIGGITYANFTTRFISYNAAYQGAPIYLKYVVIASTNSLLVGKQIVAGPITIRSVDEEGTCTRQINSPQVVAAFTGTVASFLARQADMTASLSYLMGIESSRLLIQTVEETNGMDLATVTKWSGVRVTIEFGAPAATSVNQKSPAQLASEFVSLRPMCMSPINTFTLREVYYAADEAQCDSAQFDKAVNDTLNCIDEGITPTCQCYDEFLFSPMGSACANSPGRSDFFSALCNDDVYSCKEAAVMSICTDVVNSNAKSYWWLFGVFTPLLVIAVVLFILYKKGIICNQQKSTMHTQIDEQY